MGSCEKSTHAIREEKKKKKKPEEAEKKDEGGKDNETLSEVNVVMAIIDAMARNKNSG